LSNIFIQHKATEGPFNATFEAYGVNSGTSPVKRRIEFNKASKSDPKLYVDNLLF